MFCVIRNASASHILDRIDIHAEVPRVFEMFQGEPRAIAEWLDWRSGEGALTLLSLKYRDPLIGLIPALGGCLGESDLPTGMKFVQHDSIAFISACRFEKLTKLTSRDTLKLIK